jgi:low affinity Fe/Cu permease
MIIGRKDLFSRLASRTAHLAGHPATFVTAVTAILAWAASGPAFGFSDTWQLVVNTATTVVTFLMVFLIQNTQTRDTQAMHLKLDELIRSQRGAHTALLDLEELSLHELEQFRAKYHQLAEQAREQLRRGRKDTGSPDIATD